MSQDTKRLEEQVKAARESGSLPPVEKWNPELSGDIDIRIGRDGTWYHEGKPMQREAVPRLFATILRREEDGEYYLITPVEKWRIQVEDTPLLAHTLEVEGEGEQQLLAVTTNVGEKLLLGSEHPLEVGVYQSDGSPRPVVHVRRGLEARLVTAAYYELADLLVERNVNGSPVLGVWSGGEFFEVSNG
ncbi:DUF1285 domain-containing protein [Marinobacter zhanjiangensis]|uniref:DUF1285 domain-containing protein n=1 Tax=Marinobacter zhanjiangensis TaxID=578215 RepID=A0ABQ3B6I7_9GAMM|nr:DUF1285 domain-containing protein [Marinobacter zhanjiangensis]GGY81746.1 hypothetical protein GCM10007071_31370 [Marinobacter zhanjiangensis]